jgi:hypothetical protein
MKEKNPATFAMTIGMAHALEHRLAALLDGGVSRRAVSARTSAFVLGCAVFLGVALGCAHPTSTAARGQYADTDAVTGPGVIVTLRDSPLRFGPSRKLNTEEGLIHDVDILMTVNAMKVAGAKALAINGERLTATSAITGVGASVYVNGRKVALPLQIRAIGDPVTMASYLRGPAGPLHPNGNQMIYLKEISLSVAGKLTLPAAR